MQRSVGHGTCHGSSPSAGHPAHIKDKVTNNKCKEEQAENHAHFFHMVALLKGTLARMVTWQPPSPRGTMSHRVSTLRTNSGVRVRQRTCSRGSHVVRSTA